MESEYLKSETESPVKSYPLSGFLTLIKSGAPFGGVKKRPGGAEGEGKKAARSPLGAALEGMLCTPGRVPREAAPRNKCRVPWQQREFPSRGGRKRPQPSSRLRKQNPIPLPGEQDGRKATPRRGAGRLRNLGNPFSFQDNVLSVGGD